MNKAIKITTWTSTVLIRSLLLLVFIFLPFAADAASGITYHGRILKPNGSALDGNVYFKIQIRSPGTNNCLMYEETQQKPVTNGVFVLSIADGSVVPSFNVGTITEIFDNTQNFTFGAPSGCVVTPAYNPTSGDGRNLAVSFRENLGDPWEPMPVTTVNFVPLALQAVKSENSVKLGGTHDITSILRVENTGVPGTATPLTGLQFTELLALVNGTSTVYGKKYELLGAALTAPAGGQTGQSIRWNGTAWEYFTPSAGSITGVQGTSGDITVSTVGGVATVGLDTVASVTPGTYGNGTNVAQVTVDGKGRVTGVTNVAITGASPTGTASGDLTGSYPGPSIAAGAVTLAKMASDSVDSSKIVNDSIVGADLNSNIAITTTNTIQAGSLVSSGDVTGVNGIFTGNVGAGTMSTRALGISNVGGNTLSLTVPAGAFANYALTLPSGDGASGFVLTTNGSGALSWTSKTTGSITSVGVTAPIQSTGGTTPTLSMNVATASQDGYLSSTDWTTFNNKLAAVAGSLLNDGQMWLGNGSNQATAVTMSGDASISNTGALTISNNAVTTAKLNNQAVTFGKMQNINSLSVLGRSTVGSGSVEELTLGSGLSIVGGVLSASGTGGTVTNVTASAPLSSTGGATPAISISAGTADGQVLRWSNASSDWTKSKLKYTDLVNGVGASPWPASCNAGEALTYSTVTDAFSCTPISVSTLALNTGKVWIGNASNVATEQTLSGDATISASGDLTIASKAVNFGKFQDIASLKLLGRGTAGSGSVEELSLGTGLSLVGGVLSSTSLGSVAGSSLTDGQMWLGNGSNQAAAVTMSGDVTIANTGVTTITNNSITTAKVNNQAITFSKMQNIATARLLGRSTAGSGSPEELTLGTGLSLVGGVLSSTSLGAVTGTSLNSGLIWVGDGSNTAQPVAMSGDVSITNAGVASITNNSVTTAKINDSAVTTAKVNDKAVTFGKIQDIATLRLLGRGTAGSGSVEELSLGSGLSLVGGVLSSTSLGSVAGSTLNDGQMWLGNGSNQAAAVTMSGDATITNAGSLTIANQAVTFGKIQNIATQRILGRSTAGSGSAEELTLGTGLSLVGGVLSAAGTGGTVTSVSASGPLSVATGTTTPVISISNGTADGQVLRWSTASSDWTKSKLKYTDLVNGVGASPWPASCGAGEALSYSTVTDSFSCVAISVSNLALNTGKIWIGNASNVATEQTMSGDASIGASGDLTIANNAITTGKLNNQAVTFAKMQNIATARILGRSTGGSGSPEELSLGTGLSLVGGVLSSTSLGTVTGSSLNSGLIWLGDGSNTAQPVAMSGDATLTNAGVLSIANNAVTTAKVNNQAITFAKMQNIATARILGRATSGSGSPEELTIGSGLSLSGGALTATGVGSIVGSTLNDGQMWLGNGSNQAAAVTMSGDASISNAGSLLIANNAVTTAKINDSAVTTAKLNNQAVTFAKMQNIATARLLGRSTAGSGSPEELSLGTGLSLVGGVLSSTSLGSVAGSTLNDGQMWLGNGSNQAAAVTMSGDASISNAGALTIANNAVTTAKVNDQAITLAKIQNIATQRLLGRSTAGAGSAEEISLGSGLSLVGGVLSAVTGGGGTVTSVSASGPLSVATGTTTPVISISNGSADGQVLRWSNASSDWTKSKLKYTDLVNGVGASPWPSTCVAGEALTYSTVTDAFSCTPLVATIANTAALANGKMWLGDVGGKAQEQTMSGDASISNAGVLTIAADAITSGKILDSAVTTNKIATQAVTFARMQNIATNKLLGRSTAGNGSPEELTIGSGISLVGGVISATGSGGDFMKDGSVAMTGNLQLNGNWLSNDGNNEGIRVDNSGNVGVGLAPSYKFQVHDTTDSAWKRLLVITDADVANGITDEGPTTGIFQVGPIDGNKGGAEVLATSDSGDTSGLKLQAAIGVTDPTDNIPAIQITGAKRSGTALAALGNAETVLHIRNYGAAPAITVLGDGDVGIGTTTPGAPLDIKGIMRLSGSTSGYVGFQAVPAAGSVIWTLPTGDGTSGQSLVTNGSGKLSWASSSGGDFLKNGSVDMTGALKIVDGAVGTPGLAFASDPDTGIYRTGTNTMAFSGGGSLGMSINASNVILNKVSLYPNGSAAAPIIASNTSNDEGIYFSGSDTVDFAVEGARVGYFASTGLKMGTSKIIESTNGTAAAPGYSLPSSGSGMYGSATSEVAFSTSSTQRLRIDSSGKVGVNQTGTINGQFDVKGSIVMSGSTSGYVGFQAVPAAGSVVWTLPTGDGTSGQVLQTNGSGKLSWAAAGGTGDFKADGSVSMTGTLKASAGTNSLPSLTFSGDTDTGLYSDAGNTIKLTVGGAQIGTINSAGLTISNTSNDGAVVANEIKALESSSTVYAATGTGQAPRTEGLQTQNLSFTNSGFALMNGTVYNSSMNSQMSYIATISNSGAGVYSPSIAIGQSTGSNAYAESMRIDGSGNVGIGTTTPRAKLDVNGLILMKPAVGSVSSPIDFSTGNLQYTTGNCGAYRLDNLKDGGSYTFAVKGTAVATCSFTAFTGVGTGALSVHMPPDHGATTSGKHTIYTILVMGSDVYISWMPGMVPI